MIVPCGDTDFNSIQVINDGTEAYRGVKLLLLCSRQRRRGRLRRLQGGISVLKIDAPQLGILGTVCHRPTPRLRFRPGQDVVERCLLEFLPVHDQISTPSAS